MAICSADFSMSSSVTCFPDLVPAGVLTGNAFEGLTADDFAADLRAIDLADKGVFGLNFKSAKAIGRREKKIQRFSHGLSLGRGSSSFKKIKSAAAFSILFEKRELTCACGGFRQQKHLHLKKRCKKVSGRQQEQQ